MPLPPCLADADPVLRRWWQRVVREDLDDAFLATVLTLVEALRRTPAEAQRLGQKRLAGYHRAAALAPSTGQARSRLERKAAVIDALLRHAPAPLALPADEGPTPQTVVRRGAAAPITWLRDQGRLDDAEALAALRLRRVIEGLTRPLMARVSHLDGVPGAAEASGPGRVLDLLPGELALEHSRLYLPWAAEVNGWARRPPYRPLPLILDVVVYDRGLDAVRRRHHCSADTAFADLKAGLALYARRAGLGRFSPRRPLDAEGAVM
ncbi:hypothetical protein [Pararhodospirillum photometricum]|uniref:Uncharacterized protein n=1 Tax=Pararhodospirillum photometricum DSM 122 TaxID=1150469 RepID=H6SRY1_PARPM|nr:hypothetical protein [Pararhodospirillum photometricum]CCG07660.1 unnamed protein product [Pararhodospirillum photometricum DSM 122]